MTAALNPLIARFQNEPSLLQVGSEARFEAMLTAAAAHPAMEKLQSDEMADSGDSFWGEPGTFKAALRPYVVDNGVLMIPVRGVLLHDFPYAFFGLATGYEYISKAIERGVADAGVRGIALIIDSPGGTVAGCFDCSDEIFAARGVKPIAAFADEHAYSAAYAIFSAASNGTVARTGGVGSIGVVTTHVDYSKALDQAGIKVTFIHAGAHKVDGNAYEPLPRNVKARIQTRIDSLYAVFTATVARNRGIPEQAVRDTEALTFTADEAVSNGLADDIGKLDDALAAFAASLDDQSDNTGDDAMADKPNESAVDQAAEIDAARTDGEATGRSAGATAERERISAILGSEEAKGREALANHLALETDTPVDAAKGILAAANKTEEKGSETPFNDAMGKSNPEVGADVGGKDDEDEGLDPVALARGAGLRCIRPQASK